MTLFGLLVETDRPLQNRSPAADELLLSDLGHGLPAANRRNPRCPNVRSSLRGNDCQNRICGQ